MVWQGWLTTLVVGAGFVLLGLGVVFWGRREERRYYESLTARRDLREFFSRWPLRPEPGAIKIGGLITIAVGLVIAVVGAVFGLIA